MRLYVTPFAPNAMRVQVFMLEKAISADVIDVSTVQAGEYLKLNPLGQVPALELDSGELITESLTICQYLDAMSGEPLLFGSTPEERARIGMWERRAELALFIPSVEYGHHHHPMFAGRIAQHPEWANTLVPKAARMIQVMADQLDRAAFLAGDTFSAADLTAALGYSGLVAFGALPPDAPPSVQTWLQAMMARPSFEPLRQAAQFLQSAAAGPVSAALAQGEK
jgi:glutathione S-transferase